MTKKSASKNSGPEKATKPADKLQLPMDFEEAVAAFLATPPPQKATKKKPAQKRKKS